jgi:L-threonylcarbamoyladenylate synthase
MASDADVQRVITAVREGQAVLLPTDTVYGLVASAQRAEEAARLYRLKGRGETQPTALLASTIEQLLAALPELPPDAEVIVRTLLPGPYTLVLPNPAQRFRWLAGGRPGAIGVRVPDLPEVVRRVIDATGCVLATSANEPGGPSPVSLDEVPQRIRDGCGAELDIGPLPGTPSTVIDFTTPDPDVIREGAGPAAEALARVEAALVGPPH